jgi:predicted site-specific integrase-resolvase
MEYLTLKEAADMKGRSRDSVKRWIDIGLLKPRYGPRGTMINRDELEAMPMPRLGRPPKEKEESNADTV